MGESASAGLCRVGGTVPCCCCLVTQECLTLCDPVDCSPPGSCDRGILQARIVEWGCHALLQGIFPSQGSNLSLLLGRQILNHWAPREAWTVSTKWPFCPLLRTEQWPGLDPVNSPLGLQIPSRQRNRHWFSFVPAAVWMCELPFHLQLHAVPGAALCLFISALEFLEIPWVAWTISSCVCVWAGGGSWFLWIFTGLPSSHTQWMGFCRYERVLPRTQLHVRLVKSQGVYFTSCIPGGSASEVFLQCGRPRFNPCIGKIPWRRKRQPTPVLLPGKSHGRRSLVGSQSVGDDWATSPHYYVQWASRVAELVKNLAAMRGRFRLFATPWTAPHQASLSIRILQARTLEWVARPSSRGSSQTKGSNPGLPHCNQILYQLSQPGSPRILEWVAYHFSRGSSWPRSRTGVSCTAGRFFTSEPQRKPTAR